MHRHQRALFSQVASRGNRRANLRLLVRDFLEDDSADLELDQFSIQDLEDDDRTCTTGPSVYEVICIACQWRELFSTTAWVEEREIADVEAQAADAHKLAHSLCLHPHFSVDYEWGATMRLCEGRDVVIYVASDNSDNNDYDELAPFDHYYKGRCSTCDWRVGRSFSYVLGNEDAQKEFLWEHSRDRPNCNGTVRAE